MADGGFEGLFASTTASPEAGPLGAWVTFGHSAFVTTNPSLAFRGDASFRPVCDPALVGVPRGLLQNLTTDPGQLYTGEYLCLPPHCFASDFTRST